MITIEDYDSDYDGWGYPPHPSPWTRNTRNISVNRARNWGQSRNKAATKPATEPQHYDIL